MLLNKREKNSVTVENGNLGQVLAVEVCCNQLRRKHCLTLPRVMDCVDQELTGSGKAVCFLYCCETLVAPAPSFLCVKYHSNPLGVYSGFYIKYL